LLFILVIIFIVYLLLGFIAELGYGVCGEC